MIAFSSQFCIIQIFPFSKNLQKMITLILQWRGVTTGVIGCDVVLFSFFFASISSTYHTSKLLHRHLDSALPH